MTNFEKYRRCYYVGLAIVAIVLVLTFSFAVFMKLTGFVPKHGSYLISVVLQVLFIVAGVVLALLMGRYEKCPYCGRSVFGRWRGLSKVSRILKRKPIICAYCGEEVETE